jgi:plastocyanin
MFTTESRVYLGISAVALVAAIAYAIGTDDHMGSVLFLSAFAAAAFLGGLMVRAGRLEASAPIGSLAEREGGDRRFVAPTFWPVAAAVAIAVLLVGFTTDKAFFVLGLGAAVLAALGWYGQTFRDHRDQADPNALIVQDRIISPAGLPLIAAVGIAIVVISFSRILLAASETGAWIIALAAAALIMLLCTLIALKPISTAAIAGIAALAGLVVVVGGVSAASRGERTFERHAADPTKVVAKGTAFTETQITLIADQTNLVQFTNQDSGVLHNMSFYRDEAATKAVYNGQVFSGPGKQVYTFNAGGPGTLYYRCDVHPQQMKGTATVKAAASEGEG